MVFPDNLSTLVADLSATTAQVEHFDGLLARARADEQRLRSELLALLDRAGFTEEAVELLLAAHKR